MDATKEVKNVRRRSALAGRKRKMKKKVRDHSKEEKQLKEEGSIHNSKKIRKDQEENNKHHLASSSTSQLILGNGGLDSQEPLSEAQQRKDNSLLSCCSLYLIPSSTTNVDNPSDPTPQHFTTTANGLLNDDDADGKETSGSIFSIRPSNPLLDLLPSDASTTTTEQMEALPSTKPVNTSKVFTISTSTEFPLSLDDAIVYHGSSGSSITVELAGGLEEEFALEAGQEKSCFSLLSEELVVEIFSFLRVKSVVVCCFVCRQWHRIGMTNCLWVRLTRAVFPTDCDDEEEEEEEDADAERGNPNLRIQCRDTSGSKSLNTGDGKTYRANARGKFIVKFQREREREKRMFTLQEPEAYIYHMSLDELWDRTSGLPERIDIAITAAEKATEYNQCGNFLEAFEVSKTAIYFLERLIRECKPDEGRTIEEANQRRYLSWHLVLADVYTFKGLALRKMDYHSLAIVNYNKSICISEQVQENYPDAEEAKLSREFMATACKNCGVALSLLGRPQEALMYCDKGIELLKAVLHESWAGGSSLAHMRIDTLLTFITNRFKVLSDLGLWERAAKDMCDVFRTLRDLQRMNHSLCADPDQTGQPLLTGEEFNALLNLRGESDAWSSATADDEDDEDVDSSQILDDLKFCGEVWQGLCFQVHEMAKRAKTEFCTALGEYSPRVLRLLARSLTRRFGDKNIELGIGNGNGTGERKAEASLGMKHQLTQ